MPTHIFCYLLFWCYKQQVQQKKKLIFSIVLYICLFSLYSLYILLVVVCVLCWMCNFLRKNEKTCLTREYFDVKALHSILMGRRIKSVIFSIFHLVLSCLLSHFFCYSAQICHVMPHVSRACMFYVMYFYVFMSIYLDNHNFIKAFHQFYSSFPNH